MTPTQSTCDICVVGAGPAGATIAQRLASRGFDVLILGSESSRRRQVETVPSAIRGLLDELLPKEYDQEGMFQPARLRIQWGGEEVQRSAEEGMLLVDRSKLDALLQRAAEHAGARIARSAKVTHIQHPEDFSWRLSVAGGGVVTCRFLVDAAGRRGCLRAKRRRHSPVTLSLWADWEATEEVCASTVYVEAGPERWYWGAALPGSSRFSAMIFIDPARRGQIDAAYESLLSESATFRHLIGRRLTLVTGIATTVSCVLAPVGDDWIKVGESAVSLDPLSSQGVLAAVSGGMQAAAVANTLLRYSDTKEMAQRFYQDRVSATAKRNAETAATFYRRQSDLTPARFWLDRSSVASSQPEEQNVKVAWNSELEFNISSDVRIELAPVLIDEVIRSEPAVVHPRLPQPVVWLGRCHLPTLLDAIPGRLSAAEILERWGAYASVSDSRRVLRWCYENDVLRAIRNTSKQATNCRV